MLRLQDFWDMPDRLANSRSLNTGEKMLLAAILYAYREGCDEPSIETLLTDTGTTVETLTVLEDKGYVFPNPNGSSIESMDFYKMEEDGVIEVRYDSYLEKQRERNLRKP